MFIPLIAAFGSEGNHRIPEPVRDVISVVLGLAAVAIAVWLDDYLADARQLTSRRATLRRTVLYAALMKNSATLSRFQMPTGSH